MKKIIFPIILTAFLIFSFIAPEMTAETREPDKGKAVGLKSDETLQIPIPTTLLLFSTGLIGLIAITRKTRHKRK